MAKQEETPEQTQNTLERLYLVAGLGTPRCLPEELNEWAAEKENWAFLLELLPLGPGLR